MKDDVVWTLNANLTNERNEEQFVLREFWLFVIRDASGVLFDVYLLDEDNIFVALTSAVREDDVLSVGIELLAAQGGCRLIGFADLQGLSLGGVALEI